MADNKLYHNDTHSLEILWQPDKCSHCGNCINGLPAVFDIAKRPWINMSGATPQEIVDQVNLCPSGAISIARLEK